MRRLILMTLCLMSLSAFAQNSEKVEIKSAKAPSIEDGPRNTSTVPVEHKQVESLLDNDPLNQLWYEDFDGSFNTANGQWNTSGKDSQYVYWDTVGPKNLQQFGWGPLPSPTNENGFALFDWFGNFPDPSGFATSPAEGTLTSPVIDLGTNINGAVISFYQQLFWCCEIDGEIYLEISTDGGQTFTDSIVVNSQFDRNERHWNLGLGYYFEYDISNAVQADPTNVVLRFNWTSLTSDQNGQYSNAYFWMIDDIRIFETPNNDLSITDYAISSVNTDGIVQVSYGQIPKNQSPEAFGLSGIVNTGLNDQTNTISTLYVRGPNQTTYSNNSQAQLLEQDSFRIAENHIDLSNEPSGEYTYAYSVSSDSMLDYDPAGLRPPQDTITSPNVTVIGDTVYAVDNGFANREYGTNTFTGDMDGIRYANAIAVKQEDTLTAVRINLGPATAPGAIVVAQVRDTLNSFGDGFQGNGWNVLLESELYEITSADTTAGFVEIPIPEVVGSPQNRVLEPDLYYVGAELYSNSQPTDTTHVSILDDNTSNQGAFASIHYSPSDGRWYTNPNALHIRAIFGTTKDQDIGIEKLGELSNVKLHPNPASHSVQLNVDTDVASDYNVVITNISGKIVKRFVESNTSSIDRNIDVSDLASGIYTVQVKSDKAIATRKLVVSH